VCVCVCARARVCVCVRACFIVRVLMGVCVCVVQEVVRSTQLCVWAWKEKSGLTPHRNNSTNHCTCSMIRGIFTCRVVQHQPANSIHHPTVQQRPANSIHHLTVLHQTSQQRGIHPTVQHQTSQLYPPANCNMLATFASLPSPPPTRSGRRHSPPSGFTTRAWRLCSAVPDLRGRHVEKE
jgi:hypothetical protein